MGENKLVAQTELALLGFLTLLFALLLLFSFFSLPMAETAFLFSALTAIFLLVYFRSALPWALAISAVVVLVYAAYLLYGCLLRGTQAPARLYFFLAWFPLTVWLFWLFTRRTADLAAQNARLREVLETSAAVDPRTGAGNLRAYARAMPLYLSLAIRCRQTLSLIVWQGIPSGPDTLDAVTALLFQEDELYLVSKAPRVFALAALRGEEGEADALLENLRGALPGQNVGRVLIHPNQNGREPTAQALLDTAMAALRADMEKA